eukprot:2481815-Heterocapsa_arctica.AAC.1
MSCHELNKIKDRLKTCGRNYEIGNAGTVGKIKAWHESARTNTLEHAQENALRETTMVKNIVKGGMIRTQLLHTRRCSAASAAIELIVERQAEP